MQIKKVAVIGAGTMGSSIAVAVARSGFPVLLKDINQEAVDAGLQRINRFFASLVRKGLSQSDADSQLKLIEPVTDYNNFADVDLAIEAVAEQIDIKREVVVELDNKLPKHAILASNTSSLPITRLAAFTKRPDKVVGLHFFNPAHLMKLVEVIPALTTAESTVQSVMSFGESLNKLAVRVEECPSFLVNRLLARYMNESLWCLQEGLATIDEIDEACSQFVMPIGPLALRDMNGADIGLSVASFNFQEYGERFKPAPILAEMVRQNLLGQKTGAGFYLYDAETRKKIGPNPKVSELVAQVKDWSDTVSRISASTAGSTTAMAVAVTQDTEKKRIFDVEQLFLPMINEAFLVLQEKICDMKDLDPALTAGLGMRKGPLALASEIGLRQCLEKITALYEQYGERFRPAPLLKRYVWAGRNTIEPTV